MSQHDTRRHYNQANADTLDRLAEVGVVQSTIGGIMMISQLLNTCNNCRGESMFIVGRGLCTKCYRNKRIRAQYPAVVIRDRKRSNVAANGTVLSDWLENYRLLDREMPIDELEPGTLPCIACDATVKVDEFDLETAIRVRCPWSICKACQKRKGKA